MATGLLATDESVTLGEAGFFAAAFGFAAGFAIILVVDGLLVFVFGTAAVFVFVTFFAVFVTAALGVFGLLATPLLDLVLVLAVVTFFEADFVFSITILSPHLNVEIGNF